MLMSCRSSSALRGLGHDPVVLRGGMGAKERAAALARLQPRPGGPPLLGVATGPYAGDRIRRARAISPIMTQNASLHQHSVAAGNTLLSQGGPVRRAAPLSCDQGRNLARTTILLYPDDAGRFPCRTGS